MINSDTSPEEQIKQQQKIIDALLRRARREQEFETSQYSLFQSAMSLQSEVWSKTDQLKDSEIARRRTESNIVDIVESMSGGFALFTNGFLAISNVFFRLLLPDMEEQIVHQISLEEYYQLLKQSTHVKQILDANSSDDQEESLTLNLTDNRWFQLTQLNTSSGNAVLLLTEISGIMQQNQEEHEHLKKLNEERKVVEHSLRLAKEEAEATVLDTSRFLAAASHDLLQPISAAKLLVFTLVDALKESDLSDVITRLERSFVSIDSLLHALLDLSRLDSPGTKFTIEDFPLDKILNQIRLDYSDFAKQHGLELKVISSKAWVKSDQHYLMRCLQNLVVNAIQYTPRGRILVGCRNRKDKIIIEVWDTGIGIKEEDQKRIFTAFSRVGEWNSDQGVGLGLSIVERASRHLNYKVRLKSEHGKGSVFSLELPKIPEGNYQLIDEDEISANEGAMDLIVVVIENNEDVLFATTRVLIDWGASVLSARSTDEALELIESIGVPPDIILSDYQLDNEEIGTETIKAIRKQSDKNIPAIMITAVNNENLLSLSEEQDFAILMKPFQLPQLRALIDWKTRNLPFS